VTAERDCQGFLEDLVDVGRWISGSLESRPIQSVDVVSDGDESDGHLRKGLELADGGFIDSRMAIRGRDAYPALLECDRGSMIDAKSSFFFTQSETSAIKLGKSVVGFAFWSCRCLGSPVRYTFHSQYASCSVPFIIL
jgi:hypothetical protein